MLSDAKVTIGEIQELLPIVVIQPMLPLPVVIADEVTDRRLHWWHISHAESDFSEEPIDRLGKFPGKKRASGIPPIVLLGCCDVDRPGSHECHKHMPIDGQVVYPITVFLEISIEPMGSITIN